MNSEEKTMQRVLEEIIKNQPILQRKKNSYGKIYYHTYYLQGRQQKAKIEKYDSIIKG